MWSTKKKKNPQKFKVHFNAYLQCTAWCHPEDDEPTDSKKKKKKKIV
jgi:hypothetical protein